MLPGSIKTTRLLKLAGLVVLAIAVGACESRKLDAKKITSAPPASENLPRGNALVGTGWVLTDGTRSTFTDYHGKVLVVDFYATWCEPCRDSIPRLIAFQKRYGSSGLQVVGLNVGGPDDRVLVNGFARELHISYPLGFPDKAVTDALLPDEYVIPQILVFDREGKLVKRFEGYDDSIGHDLEMAISAAFGSQE